MSDPRRLRVLHVTPEFPPAIWGGLGTAVGGLVHASARSGMEVGVFLVGGALVLDEATYAGGRRPFVSRADDAPADGRRTEAGIRFFQVAPGDALPRAMRFGRRWRPDVIHLHSAWLWPVARSLRDRLGTPIVFTIHSLDRAEYEIGKFVTHWQAQEEVLLSADRLIALSSSERDLLLHYCPQVTASVRIVGNGIDDLPLPERRTGRKDVLILYSGRFVDRKGIRELLDAVPRVLTAAPGARFAFVGGYGGGPEIERSWMNEVLRPFLDRIHFTGWVTPERVAEWYRVADVLVVPWLWPRVIEKMATVYGELTSGIGGAPPATGRLPPARRRPMARSAAANARPAAPRPSPSRQLAGA